MITLNDFNRLVSRIRVKLSLMIGRAVLAAIDNNGGTQKVQVVALYDETLTGVERFQEYGLETRPKTGAEVLLAFINGNRDQGIAVCVHDRRHRPKDLAEGEVVLYSSEDGGTGDHRVHLKAGKVVEVVGSSVKLGAKTGHKALCIEDLVDAINTIIGTYNSHVHPVSVPATPFVGNTSATASTETPLTKADYITVETEAT